jgi:hypothetical protein
VAGLREVVDSSVAFACTGKVENKAHSQVADRWKHHSPWWWAFEYTSLGGEHDGPTKAKCEKLPEQKCLRRTVYAGVVE